jgi:hypothetical protein
MLEVMEKTEVRRREMGRIRLVGEHDKALMDGEMET